MDKDDLLSVSDDEQEYHTYFACGVPEPFRFGAPQASRSEKPQQATVPRMSRPEVLFPTPASPQKQFFPCNPAPRLSRGREGYPAEQREPGIQPSHHSSQQRPSLQSPERRIDLPSQRSQAVVHPLPRVAMQERSESRCTTASEAELQIDLSFEASTPSQKAPVLVTVVDPEDASRPGSSVSTGTPTKQALGRKESLQADETSDEDGENPGVPASGETPTTSASEGKSGVGDDLDRLLQELQKTVTVPAEGSCKNQKRAEPIWGALVDTSGMKVRSPSDHDPIVRGKDRHFRFRVDLKREELRFKHIREAPEDKQEELLAVDQWTVDDTLNRVRYMPPVREGDAVDETPHLKLLHEHCNLLHQQYRLELQSAGVYRTSKERKEGWMHDRKKLEATEKELATEREQVVALTNDLGMANNRVTSLETQLASAKEDVTKLEKRLDAAKKQLSVQASQLKTKDQDAREAVQKELSAKDVEIASLKVEVKKLRAKQAGAAVRSTTDAEKDKADKELKRLRKANKDLTDANEKLQEELRKDNEKKLMKDVFGDDEHDDQGTQTDPLAETALIEDLSAKLTTATSDVQKLTKQFMQADQERKKAKAAAKTEHLARQEAEQALEDAKAHFAQEKEAARACFEEEFRSYKEQAEEALKEATPAAEAELEKMDAMVKKIATQNEVIKMQAARLEGARKVKEAMLKRACLKCSASRSEASTSTSLGTASVAVGTDDRPDPDYTVEGDGGLLTPPAGVSAAASTEEEHAPAIKRSRLEENAQLEEVMNTRFRPEPREGEEESQTFEFNERKPNVAELRKQAKEQEEREKLAANLTAKILESLGKMTSDASSTSTTPTVNEASPTEASQQSTSACATPEQPTSSATPQPGAQNVPTPQSAQQTPTTLEAMLRTSPRTTEEIRVHPTTLLAPTEGTLLPLHVAPDAPGRTKAGAMQRPVKGMPQQQPQQGMPPRVPQGQMPPTQTHGHTPPQQPHGHAPQQHQSLTAYRQWLQQQQQQQAMSSTQRVMLPPSGDLAQFHLHQQQAFAAQQMAAAQQHQMHASNGALAHGQFVMPGSQPGPNFQVMHQFVMQQPQQSAQCSAAGHGPSPPGRGRKRKNQQQCTPPQVAAQQQHTPPQFAAQQQHTPPQFAAQQQRTPPQVAAQQQRTPPQAVAQQQRTPLQAAMLQPPPQISQEQWQMILMVLGASMQQIRDENRGQLLRIEQYRAALISRHPQLQNCIDHFLLTAAASLPQPRAP
ncbi:hypothetical protein AAVH_16380 [Aphelenchoides avenae]|nr:hypothetical protein AAVH_16380 [Aphelenchus avenae]